MSELALAVDIGGTKTAVGLVDRSGRLIRRSQISTIADGVPQGGGDPAEALWARIGDLIRAVVAKVPSDADEIVVCGVGCGGPMSPGGDVVSPLNIPAWRSFPLRARIEELSGLRTFVENDAKALALGEGASGAARGVNHYLAMVVSTGIGGGIVLDGRLLEGRLGNAGHIGHVVVEPQGRRCVCGGQGCLEAEASGTAIAEITGREAKLASPDVVARTGTLVGRAIGSVANLLELHLAVIAGSVALGFGAPFFEAAQREIDQRCGLDFSRGTRVIAGGLGDEGPLIGAAQVAWSAQDRRADDDGDTLVLI